jgi:deazaflavin-dependent oxidoreductase (nitroreductase family)
MAVNVTPSGSRGRSRPPGPLMKVMALMMRGVHRLGLHRMDGMPVLLLTTRGARSGELRTTPVMAFPEADSTWLVVASFGGSRQHPAWFTNIARHPEDVSVEIDGRRLRVKPRSLEGGERADAWRRIVARSPRFAGYEQSTDRQIPVLELKGSE